MKSHRNTARIVGVLFIIATVASISTIAFVGFLTEPDYLAEVAANEGQVLGGVMVEFIWALSVLAIPVFLFPILRKHSDASALGFYSFRSIEAFLVILRSISLLALITLSQEYVAGVPDASSFQTLGTLLLAVRDWTLLLGPNIVLAPAALMLSYLFYQSRLVPRWLSVWGLIAAPLVLAAGLLDMFDFITPFSPIKGLLVFPIALFEMVLAVWLIVKGFNSNAFASQSA